MGTANTLWAKTFGPGTQLAASRSVAIDGPGNVIVGGDFQGTIDLGGGALTNAGSFLAKYDATGHLLWTKAFGTAGSNSSTTFVGVDASGDIVAAGWFSGTINCGGGALVSTGSGVNMLFVARFDSAGNHLWSKIFGGGTDLAAFQSMALDGSGAIVLAGTHTQSISFGGTALSGGGDFVVKLDSTDGDHVWSKTLPSTTGAFVAVDGSHAVIFAGAFSSSADFGGGPLASAGGFDIAVAKLDASGNHVWSKRFGGADDDGADGVSVDAAGNVVLAGLSTGTINLGGGALPSGASFVGKLDASGNHVWSKGFGGMVQIQDVMADGSNGILVAGGALGAISLGTTSLPASSGGMDVLVLRLDSAGNYVWGRRAGAGSTSSAAQIAVNAGHASAIAGSTRSGSLNLGTGALPACAGLCAVVAKIGP